MKRLALVFAVVSAFAGSASAQAHESSVLLENSGGQNQAYTGVGRLSGASTCTAFLIETLKTSPAYVLTAGHCVDRDAQQVILGKPGSGRVSFNYFVDTADRRVTAGVRRIAYSTMKGIDIAVLELDSTLGELTALGIRPLSIVPSAPRAGVRVVNVGIPASGIPPGESFARRAVCTLGTAADLVEFTWHWFGTLRNDCPDVMGGSSGSPLMLERDAAVIGVLGTTTAGSEPGGGGFDCYLNRPCEIVAGGSRVEPDMSYISPVAGLGACFDSGGAFDVNLASCPLDNGRQLRIERPAQRMLQPPATWQATVTGDAFAYYRYKNVRAGAGDCRSLDGYSGPRRVADSNRIDDPIGVENGVYFLCVVGGEVSRMDGAWQDPRFASATLVIIDSTPPVESVRYRLDTAGADSYRLSFEFAPPELSSYSYKIGPPETSNCADPSGYLIYRRVPLVIRAAEPSAVCAKAQDEAGNFSPPIEIRLDGERILPFGIVNAASFRPGPIAPGQLVSVFGVNLPGETVTLTDAAGVARPARILYSSPWQVNLLVPAEASLGPGRLAVSDREAQAVQVASAAPGLFLAGRQGPGPAILLVRVRADGSREVEPAFRCENANCALSPLQLGAGSEEHFLEILGTGIRGAVSGVRARIGRQPVEVRGPGPQESLEGLDRIILKLPRPFLLRGYQQVTLEAGGQQANGVFLWFK